MLEVDIETDDGDVLIREDELASVTADDLKMLRLSRPELKRIFELGRELMQGKTQADRVRPVAGEMNGRWEVRLVYYSPDTDPLMNGTKGTA